jgi:hypothetical protein
MRFQSLEMRISRMRAGPERHAGNPGPGNCAVVWILPDDAASDHLLLLSAHNAFSMQGFELIESICLVNQ